ncbi:hypothetical protein N9N30_02605 [Candidatus Pelagibacter bacterium]|nr:hypothetical protein [Candidatus Pelagibacter bacterium]MDA8834440.1 hypothetical protein [Candidatus Pelagibacter bacterium]
MKKRGNIDIGFTILMEIEIYLIMIYLSTDSILGILDHWGKRNDDAQKQIMEN